MKLLTVPKAIENVTGIRPPDGTWRRWVMTGLANRSSPGSRIRLRVLKYGGRVLTDESWVREFFAATSVSADQAPEPAITNDSRIVAAANYLNVELGEG